LLVGYCFGIRSERLRCEEVHLELGCRWICRLGLDGDVPDHSTFSKNRHGRFRECNLLRELFETVVTRCMAEGLVGGEGFAVYTSLIKAHANRQRCVASDEGLRAPDQDVYFDALFDAITFVDGGANTSAAIAVNAL
jgi:transposase